MKVGARLVLAAAVGACVVLSSCSGPGAAGSVSAVPSVGEVVAVSSPEQVRRPVDAVRLGSAQLVQLEAAEVRMVNDCRRERGLPGDAAFLEPAVAAVSRTMERERADSPLWGFFSPSTAASGGFATGKPSGPTFFQGSGDAKVGQECFAQAQKAMPRGQSWVFLATLSTWPEGGPQTPVGDPRWVEAVKAWSGCMGDRGFQAGDPVAFAREQNGHQPSASQAERAAAQADVGCKVSTNLVGLGMAVQAAYDDEYLARNEAALREWRKEVDVFLSTH